MLTDEEYNEMLKLYNSCDSSFWTISKDKINAFFDRMLAEGHQEQTNV